MSVLAAERASSREVRPEGGGWTSLLVVLVVPVALTFRIGPTAILIVLVGLGLLTLGLEWEVLVALLIGVTFFLGPLKIGYGGWIAYAIPDLLGALILLRWLTGELVEGGRHIQRHPLILPFIALVAYLGLELLNPGAPMLRSVFGLRSWLMYTAFVFVGYSSFRSTVQVVRLFRVLILVGVITAAYGIWQWRGGADAVVALGGAYVWYGPLLGVQPWETTPEGQIFRSISTFMSATMFAINMALVILAALSLVISKGTRWPMKLIYLGAIVVMGGAITTTGSRMGVVYLVASAFVIAYLFRSLKFLFLAAVLGLVGIWAGQVVTLGAMSTRFMTLFDPDTYFWKWYYPLEGGFMIGVINPFGKGLGYTAGVPVFADATLVQSLPAGSTNTIDSGYGMVAAELGIIGLPIFVWFAIALAWAGMRAWRALPLESRTLFLVPTITAVAFPVFTLLSAPHASLPISAYTWLLVGMLLRAGDVERAGRESEP